METGRIAYQGLLPGSGADCAASLPRPRQSRPTRSGCTRESEAGDEISYEGKVVGRVTSTGPAGVALAYVRTGSPRGRRARDRVDPAPQRRYTDPSDAPVAQGIERSFLGKVRPLRGHDDFSEFLVRLPWWTAAAHVGCGGEMSDSTRLHLVAHAPVAQGIERCPAEAEVASSNLAGRMAQPRWSGRSRWSEEDESSSRSPRCSPAPSSSYP